MIPAWVTIISRSLICLAAGEIAIRYGAWSYLLARARERMTAAPLIVGVALWAFFRWGVEVRWLLLMANPGHPGRASSPAEADLFSEVMRLGIIAALCFLTYPVTKIQYRHSWERAVVEMIVRVFLIVIAGMAGWVLATVHFYHG